MTAKHAIENKRAQRLIAREIDAFIVIHRHLQTETIESTDNIWCRLSKRQTLFVVKLSEIACFFMFGYRDVGGKAIKHVKKRERRGEDYEKNRHPQEQNVQPGETRGQ